MNKPSRRDVSIDDIDLNDARFRFRKYATREAIKAKAESIKAIGLLNPVKLLWQGDRYTVIAGWQRLLALMELGRRLVPAEVYEGITFEDAIRINVADNHQRENLSDYETSCQMQALRELGKTVEQLAELFGCGLDRVYDLLSVAGMDPPVRDSLELGRVTLYQALMISRFPVWERSIILGRVIEGRVSVRWLKRELAELKRHPLYGGSLSHVPGVVHAVRIPTTPGFTDVRRAYWELMGRGTGMPGPNKCEFTKSIVAMEHDPPYVCSRDAEWVVLSYGRFPHRGVYGFDWDAVPLSERDGWFLYCERCARLRFPGIVLHADMYYPDWQEEDEVAHSSGLHVPQG